jgi:hypothetical protein
MTTQQKEQLRTAVLVYLVERHPLAFDSVAIARFLRRQTLVDFEPTQHDVDSAIIMLADSRLIQAPGERNRLGVTVPWKASAEGILYAEREGLS